MKTQHWIPVLAWAVLLSGAVEQARGQPKCAPGVIYQCALPAEDDKSTVRGVEADDDGRPEGRQSGWFEQEGVASSQQKAAVRCEQKVARTCEQKATVTYEPVCGIKHVRKVAPFAPGKGAIAAEPRKLALPRGSYKRLTACDSPKSPSVCGSPKSGACLTDTRRDSIFGTETIFGDISLNPLREHRLCPCQGDNASHPKPLAQMFSQLDASMQKVFVCRRGACGNSNCKGTSDCDGKSKCSCDKGQRPILDGQPEEPRLNDNPFRDDAVEPAPLPPMPLIPPESSEARRIPESQPPAHLRVVRARPVSSHLDPPKPPVGRLSASQLRPKPPSNLDRSTPSRSPKPSLLSSLGLD
jgi:hypothetical protein